MLIRQGNAFVKLMLFCALIQLIHSELEVRGFSRLYNFPATENNFLIEANHRFASYRNNLVNHLGLCDNATSTNELICNVTMYTRNIPSEGDYNVTTCSNLRLRGKDQGLVPYKMEKVSLLPLAPDKVIFSWLEVWENSSDSITHMGASIVRLDNCNSVNLNFLVTQSENYFYEDPLVVYNNSVDFFVDNVDICNSHSKNESEAKSELCVVSYDENGEKIGQPKPFNSTYSLIGYILPVSLLSSEKGFFSMVLYPEDKYLGVWFVSASGDMSLLFEITLTEGKESNDLLISMTNAHEKFSLCWQQVDVETMRCIQIDANGHLKLNVTLELPNKWFEVDSIADDGLLISFGNCGKMSNESYFDCKTFDILKIKPDGKHDNLLTIDKLDLKCYDAEEDLTEYLTETVNDEYCFSLSCREIPPSVKKGIRDFQYSEKCVPKL